MQAKVLEAHTHRGLLNCCRQWGKSTLGAVMAVHQAYTKPESLALVISPSARQSGEFVRKAARFLEKLKIQPKGDGDNEMSLLLPNRSRIIGLPSNEVTVRGFSSVALMIIDEAARVSDEMYHAVRPMLAASRGRLWLMSTPHGKRGFFYESWQHGGRGWMRVRVPATECPRIARNFLKEERTILGGHDFRQEYMCEFEDTESSVFDRTLVERAISRDVEPMVLG
jgi:phage FluMu gp28-like protein